MEVWPSTLECLDCLLVAMSSMVSDSPSFSNNQLPIVPVWELDQLLLMGLMLYRFCADNHNYCELMCASAKPYLKIGISLLSPHYASFCILYYLFFYNITSAKARGKLI